MAQQQGAQRIGQCDEGQRREEALAEMAGGGQLAPPGEMGAPDRPDQLAGALGEALVPAVLLGPPGGQPVGQLARHPDAEKDRGAPALEMDAIAEVEILGQGIGMPAPGIIDGAPAPQAASAVEGHVEIGPGPRALLDGEMRVQRQRLGAGQEILPRVQMLPARLDQGQLRFGQQREDAAGEEIARGQEIGVEDGDELGIGLGEAVAQRPRLEARAIGAPHELGVDPPGAHPLHGDAGELGGVVGAVVQHLDLQPILGPVDRGRGLDQPVDDVALVDRSGAEPRPGAGGPPAAAAPPGAAPPSQGLGGDGTNGDRR